MLTDDGLESLVPGTRVLRTLEVESEVFLEVEPRAEEAKPTRLVSSQDTLRPMPWPPGWL